VTARGKFIGKSVRRLEDRPLLTGKGRFAADISFENQLHMRVVRSPVANGRLVKVDCAAALKLPGVHAVWTAADVAHIPPIGFRLTGLTELEPYQQHVLARDRVRYVGDPVAVVFASDPYIAEDAADLVEVVTEDEPALTDVTQAPSTFDATHSTETTILARCRA
jgi:CO/xanthine dehydrogenase Mo-binding subunit